jgi:hypothetical protein
VQFKESVFNNALNIANREKLFDEEDFIERKEYQDRKKEYAMLKLAMYKCHKCSSIFCGGRRECGEEMNNENQVNPEDILCVYCAALK